MVSTSYREITGSLVMSGIPGPRLGDEESIEWITVNARPQGRAERMSEIDRQRIKAVRLEPICHVGLGGLGEGETTIRGFVGDLVASRGAEQHVIAAILDDLPHPVRQSRVLQDPPEKHVRIQQRPHRRSSRIGSSGCM